MSTADNNMNPDDDFHSRLTMKSIQALEQDHPETATKLKEMFHSNDPEKMKKMMALLLPILDAKVEKEDDSLAGTASFMLRRVPH